MLGTGESHISCLLYKCCRRPSSLNLHINRVGTLPKPLERIVITDNRSSLLVCSDGVLERFVFEVPFGDLFPFYSELLDVPLNNPLSQERLINGMT